MTRQWLAVPELMCRNHLLGEHAETHMFMTKMEEGFSLQGYIDKSEFFGAEYIKYRHDLLSKLIKGHGSPLDEPSNDLKEAYPLIVPTQDDLVTSLDDLFARCNECFVNHAN